MNTPLPIIASDSEIANFSVLQNQLFRRFVTEEHESRRDILNGLKPLAEGRRSMIIPVATPFRFPAIPAGKKWIEAEDIIYLSVTSNGWSGPRWDGHFESTGVQRTKYAKEVLRSPDFRATTGITYNMAFIRSKKFTDENRIASRIRADAEARGWSKPPVEVGCLVRELISNDDLEQLGLWSMMAMHEPVEDSDGGWNTLYTNRSVDGPWLFTHQDLHKLNDDGAVGFLVSQVSPQVPSQVRSQVPPPSVSILAI